MKSNNPILNRTPFYVFQDIQSEHFIPAIRHTISRAEEFLESCLTDTVSSSFEDAIIPVIRLEEHIQLVWTFLTFYVRIISTPDTLEAFDSAAEIFQKFEGCVFNQPLVIKRFESIRSSYEFQKLSTEQQRYIILKLQRMKPGDRKVPDQIQSEITELDLRLARLKTQFRSNLLRTELHLKFKDGNFLKCIPDCLREYFTPSVKTTLTLNNPQYFHFLKNSPDEELKKSLWRQFQSRGTDDLADNRPVIKEMIRIRENRALVMGFENHAQYSISFKNADTPGDVMDFLEEFLKITTPAASKSYNIIQEYRNRIDGDPGTALNAWEYPYWEDQYLQTELDYSESEFQACLPVDACLQGLFDVGHRLFGIRFEPAPDIPVWNPSVSVFRVQEASGELTGVLFFDLFTRPGQKEGGAWKKAVAKRLRFVPGNALCQCGIHCNFSQPLPGETAHLTPGDLQTLFHEFGHALHEVLSQTELSEMGGTRVARDVLEFPSTFFELFALQPEVLAIISQKNRTGKTISDQKIKSLVSAGQFGRALKIRNRAILALFDMKIHSEQGAYNRIHDHLLNCFKSHAIFPIQEDIFPEAGFSHIFMSGYDAGFYGYLWARVYTLNAFNIFRKKDLLSRSQGLAFRKCILESGNTHDMNTLFTRFAEKLPDRSVLYQHYSV